MNLGTAVLERRKWQTRPKYHSTALVKREDLFAVRGTASPPTPCWSRRSVNRSRWRSGPSGDWSVSCTRASSPADWGEKAFISNTMEHNATRYSVQLYIYDLSRGMARSLSPIMLGKQLDGIWHTAIVVYGDEFFFGGVGISSCSPGGTMLGPPDTVVELGKTEVSEEIFMDYLSSLGESSYRGDRYRLFEHNCNTFTNEVAQFLTGHSIPSYITDLPSEVLSTPFGQILRPILDSIHIAPPGGNVINGGRSS